MPILEAINSLFAGKKNSPRDPIDKKNVICVKAQTTDNRPIVVVWG